MCRMAGVVFRRHFPMAVMEDLKYLGQNGHVPDERSPGHPHGWGVVSFTGRTPSYMVRSPEPIYQDPLFSAVSRDIDELTSPNIVIAHVRHASKGVAKVDNTHPFIIGGVALAHNGTIQGLSPPKLVAPKGETDSELLALNLAALYEENKRDIVSAVKSLVRETIRPKEFTAAILLTSDGSMLVGYRDYTLNGDYYDLRLSRQKDRVILFQEARSEYASASEQVARGELVSVDLDLNVKKERV